MSGTGELKGPLWKPGNGFWAFLRAQNVWLRDHPVFRLWWLVVALLGFWAYKYLTRSAHGLGFWLWLGPVLFLGVTVPRLLWFRVRLQRPYQVKSSAGVAGWKTRKSVDGRH